MNAITVYNSNDPVRVQMPFTSLNTWGVILLSIPWSLFALSTWHPKYAILSPAHAGCQIWLLFTACHPIFFLIWVCTCHSKLSSGSGSQMCLCKGFIYFCLRKSPQQGPQSWASCLAHAHRSTGRHPLIITCFPLCQFKQPRLYFAAVVGPWVPTPNVDYYTEWGARSLNSEPTQSWPVPRFVVVRPIRVYATVHVLAVIHPSTNLGKHCLTSVIGQSMLTVC